MECTRGGRARLHGFTILGGGGLHVTSMQVQISIGTLVASSGSASYSIDASASSSQGRDAHASTNLLSNNIIC